MQVAVPTEVERSDDGPILHYLCITVPVCLMLMLVSGVAGTVSRHSTGKSNLANDLQMSYLSKITFGNPAKKKYDKW